MNIIINKKGIALRLAIVATIFYLIVTLALNTISTEFFISILLGSGIYFGFFYFGMLIVFDVEKVKKQFLKETPLEFTLENTKVTSIQINNNKDTLLLAKKNALQMLIIIIVGTTFLLLISNTFHKGLFELIKIGIIFGLLIIIGIINLIKTTSDTNRILAKIDNKGFIIYSYNKTKYIPWDAITKIKEFTVDGSFVFSFYIDKKYLNVSNPIKMLKIKNTEDYGIGLLTFTTKDPNKEFLLKDFLYSKIR